MCVIKEVLDSSERLASADKSYSNLTSTHKKITAINQLDNLFLQAGQLDNLFLQALKTGFKRCERNIDNLIKKFQ